MMEKMQRTRERATFVLPFPASLSPPLCPGKPFSAGEASTWGVSDLAWHCDAARPPPLQKAGVGPVPVLQSSPWHPCSLPVISAQPFPLACCACSLPFILLAAIFTHFFSSFNSLSLSSLFSLHSYLSEKHMRPVVGESFLLAAPLPSAL